ncbi:MAG TPA: GAF domain-containing protein [Thermoanaerobaculia bacterium]|nr:GAF domain-containing protein [Thermoanaerobaculia bacterium]
MTRYSSKPQAVQKTQQQHVITIKQIAHGGSYSLRGRLRRDFKELLTKLRTVQKQHDLLRQLDRAILESTSSADNVLKQIINEGRGYTDSNHGQIVLIKRHRFIVKVSSEPERVNQEIPRDASLCGTALRLAHDIQCPDVSKLPHDQYVRFHDLTRSEIVLLMRPEKGSRVFGMLTFEREQVGAFDEDAIEFARLLAGQAAIAIAQERIWKSVELLHSASTGELTLEDAYREILNSALEVLNFEHGQVLRAEEKELVVIASSRESDIGVRVLPESSVCGRYLMAEGGRTILTIHDISKGPYAAFYLPLLTTPEGRMRSEMIVPLVKSGQLIGALNIESPRVAAFTEFDSKVLELLGDLLIRSLSATFSRRIALNRERVEAANLAMTQLGHVAQSFLHGFGSMIGDVRGNLAYLRGLLGTDLAVEVKPGISVQAFLESQARTLKDGAAILDEFYDRFNPADPKFQPKRMNLTEVANRAVLRFLEKNLKSIAIDFPSAPGLDDNIAHDCMLSDIIYDVVDNLLNNAVDAIQERQEHEAFDGLIRVVVSLPDPFLARLTIIDNGAGISPENHKNVFEFGFSTKTSERSSRGIGLWFCELYVLQRGGTISFHANDLGGHGTVFELQFPTVVATSAP